MEKPIPIQVKSAKGTQEVLAMFGQNLRDALLKAGLTPYVGKNGFLNCKGMGICGTCKVLVVSGEQKEEKRSCQIQCFKPMEIELQ